MADLCSGSSPSSGSTAAAWVSRDVHVFGCSPWPGVRLLLSELAPTSTLPLVCLPGSPERPAWAPTPLGGTLTGNSIKVSNHPYAHIIRLFWQFWQDSQTGLCLAPAFVSTWSRGELWVSAATSRGTKPCSLTLFTPFSLSLSQSFSFFSPLFHKLPPPPHLACSLDKRLCTASVSSFSTASHRLLY